MSVSVEGTGRWSSDCPYHDAYKALAKEGDQNVLNEIKARKGGRKRIKQLKN